jgi:chloramphenicol 3-O-phosphotransferase
MARQPLVGRHEELAAVRSAIASARAGSGRLVVVTGAAGIGKTRLAEAAIDLAHEMAVPVAVAMRWPTTACHRCGRGNASCADAQ